MSAEVGLTEAEREALFTRPRELSVSRDTDVLEVIVARIKADAIAQERAAWVAKIEALRRALDDELANLADDGARLSHSVVRRMEAIFAAHPDATAACVCVCHSGGVGTGCRQSRCEACPPATAALNTVREQAKAEERRVHDHPPYRPACNERLVEGQLRGACLNDDGSEAGR